jgi:oxalate decarboxylase/phosphoglucose isomerase-like protein (cupin superfamily)
MDYEEIKEDGRIHAIVIKQHFSKPGLSFITPESFALQMGLWLYDKGKLLKPHLHIKNPRKIEKTQEMIYVISGRAKVSLYREDGSLLGSLIAQEGDIVFHAEGGHGYEILEDNTKVVEMKNGPFTGVESDKQLIEEK